MFCTASNSCRATDRPLGLLMREVVVYCRYMIPAEFHELDVDWSLPSFYPYCTCLVRTVPAAGRLPR